MPGVITTQTPLTAAGVVIASRRRDRLYARVRHARAALSARPRPRRPPPAAPAPAAARRRAAACGLAARARARAARRVIAISIAIAAGARRYVARAPSRPHACKHKRVQTFIAGTLLYLGCLFSSEFVSVAPSRPAAGACSSSWCCL